MDLQREYLRGARRKAREARSYFDDDDDDGGDADTSSAASRKSAGAPAAEDDDVDPLDAFMLGIESQVAREREQRPAAPKVRGAWIFWLSGQAAR